MSRLFILGNGFDKAHGIACDYSDFGHYLGCWCLIVRPAKGAPYNGWKPHPHPERTNQSTGSESWSRSGNARFKRRQLGGRDGY